METVDFASCHKDIISSGYLQGKTAVTVLGNFKSPLYDTVYKHVKGRSLT